MPSFAEKYTQNQREACVVAYDPPRTSAQRVTELAAAGELIDATGAPLESFEVAPSTVRDFARKANRRRATAAREPSDLAGRAPRDAVETLRQRLVAVTDRELQLLERQQREKPDAPIDLEKLRQLARATLEISRLPGPTDPRPPTADTRDPVTGLKGVAARGGFAGALLQDHRASNGGTAAAETLSASSADLALEAGDADEPPAVDPLRKAMREDLDRLAQSRSQRLTVSEHANDDRGH